MTTETQAPDPGDRVLALQDRAYVAGAQAGFALGSAGDSAGLEKLCESRREAVAVLKQTRAAAIPAPEGAQALTDEQIDALHDSMFPRAALESDRVKVRAFVRAALAAPAPQAPVALTVQQIIDATVQIDVTQPAWIVKLARAIEAAHGIPAPKEPTNDR